MQNIDASKFLKNKMLILVHFLAAVGYFIFIPIFLINALLLSGYQPGFWCYAVGGSCAILGWFEILKGKKRFLSLKQLKKEKQ